MRNKYLALLAAIMVCMVLHASPVTVQAAFDAPAVNEQLNTGVTPTHIYLSWSDNPKTTQTVTWWTNDTIQKSLVQYREVNKSEDSNKTIEGTTEHFVTAVELHDKPGQMNVHTVNLTGLKPGQTYTYRVGDGRNWSDYSTFTTENPKAESFKVLLFADSQNDKANYQQWHDTLVTAYEKNKDAKFFINLGDMSDQGQDFHFFNNWFDASAGVINKIPQMPVLGNHECREGVVNGIYGDPVYFKKLFKVPNNGPEGMKVTNYSFDYGNAHFVMLDSQILEQYKTPEAQKQAIQAEIEWLDKDLAGSQKTWKFVLYHRSQYYLKTTRTSTYMKAFEPTLDKYHVDAVICGHDHGMCRTWPIKDGQYMSKPADGTIYFTTGRTNLNTKSDINIKVWNAFQFDPQDLPVYQTMEVTSNKATIKTFETSGRLIDVLHIDKKNPDNSTLMVPSGRLEEPRMILFGSPITYGSLPQEKNGTWYVDFKIIVDVMDAKYDKESNTLTFKKPKKTVQLTDAMFLDGKRKLISIDALRSIGFECSHQEKTNFILIERINNG